MEIVTHCYHYPRLLRYQLSSLLLSPPAGVNVTMTVCFAEEDEPTWEVLEWFGAQAVSCVQWNWLALPALELCRRSIGRNRAALATEADWIWFSDADYLWGAGCWTALAMMPEPRKPLIYPRMVQMQRWRGLGDASIAAVDVSAGLVQVNPGDFAPVRMRRAIGGIQIARGAVCRDRGYLRHWRKWQTPPQRAVFQKCREDLFFRRDLGTSGQAVELPEVYRLRHSRAGRDDPALRL